MHFFSYKLEHNGQGFLLNPQCNEQMLYCTAFSQPPSVRFDVSDTWSTTFSELRQRIKAVWPAGKLYTKKRTGSNSDIHSACKKTVTKIWVYNQRLRENTPGARHRKESNCQFSTIKSKRKPCLHPLCSTKKPPINLFPMLPSTLPNYFLYLNKDSYAWSQQGAVL